LRRNVRRYSTLGAASFRRCDASLLEGPLAMAAAAHLAAGLGGFSFIDLDTALFVSNHPFHSEALQDQADWQLAGVRSGHGVTVA